MKPNLESGQKGIAWKFGQMKKGDIVIFKEPSTGLSIIKRISKTKQDLLYLEGDNKKESTDSRDFGWIKKQQIIGTVIYPRFAKQ